MHIMAPKNKWELSDMLKFAIRFDGPIAIRYPRGKACDLMKEYRAPIEYGKAEILETGKDIAILAVGSMVETALMVRQILEADGMHPTLVNARFVKPIDTETIDRLMENHSVIVTMEENVESGGFGEKVRSYIDENGYNLSVLSVCVPDEYVEHGNVEILRKEIGIDAESVINKIIQKMGK